MSIVLLPFSKSKVIDQINWDALYKEHVGRVYNYFRYRVGDSATAEDLTATTFEKAWKKRKRFRGKADKFTHWLYAIARNVANDYFRKSPNLLSLDDVLTLPATDQLSEKVADKLEFERLVCWIQKMPARTQEILTLKYGASLTNRQIAHQLNLSESNIGSILHRAIHKLRQQMEVDNT